MQRREFFEWLHLYLLSSTGLVGLDFGWLLLAQLDPTKKFSKEVWAWLAAMSVES